MGKVLYQRNGIGRRLVRVEAIVGDEFQLLVGVTYRFASDVLPWCLTISILLINIVLAGRLTPEMVQQSHYDSDDASYDMERE